MYSLPMDVDDEKDLELNEDDIPNAPTVYNSLRKAMEGFVDYSSWLRGWCSELVGMFRNSSADSEPSLLKVFEACDVCMGCHEKFAEFMLPHLMFAVAGKEENHPFLSFVVVCALVSFFVRMVSMQKFLWGNW